MTLIRHRYMFIDIVSIFVLYLMRDHHHRSCISSISLTASLKRGELESPVQLPGLEVLQGSKGLEELPPIAAELEDAELLRELLRPRGDRLCLCLLYTSPSPRDLSTSRMPSSA